MTTLPISVPYSFAGSTTQNSLANLDSDFTTIYSAVNGISNGSVALATPVITGVASFTNVSTNFGPVSVPGGPNIYCVNTSGSDGAGSSIVFLNNNSAAVQKTSAYINGGFLIATANAEQGLIDFEVLDGTNGVNRIIGMAVNTGGTSATFAPNTDNYWNLGLNGYRWSNLYAVNANFTTGYFSNNVGIGNSAPAYRLQVNTSTNGNDGISVTNNSTDPFAQAFINVNAAGWNGVQLLQNQSLGLVRLYTGDNVPIVFATNTVDRMTVSSNGNVGVGTSSPGSLLTVAGPISLKAPSSINLATYTVSSTDSSLIFTTTNNTLTMPSASLYSGRVLYIKNITANSVTSASSNVVPLASATPGTAILPATSGKFAMLQSDGSNWITMLSN